MSIDHAEEARLIDRWRRGERSAGDALVKMHAGVIHLVALQFAGLVDMDDLLQEARMGFLASAERAQQAAKGAHAVKVSSGAIQRAIRVKRESGEAAGWFGRAQSLDAMAEDSGSSPLERVRDDAPLADEALESARVGRELRRHVHGLAPRERVVVEQRYLCDNPRTLQEVGDGLGLTRERARQIEAIALGKIRRALQRSE